MMSTPSSPRRSRGHWHPEVVLHAALMGQFVWAVFCKAPVFVNCKWSARETGYGRRDHAHVVPSARAMHVRALVASELVNEDAGVAVEVNWAATATRGAAGSDCGTIGLMNVR